MRQTAAVVNRYQTAVDNPSVELGGKLPSQHVSKLFLTDFLTEYEFKWNRH